MPCYDGFGNISNESVRVWTGRFSPIPSDSGKTSPLLYNMDDGNLWLGILGSTTINWTPAGNTLGVGQDQPAFGNIADGRPVWIGDFDGDGLDNILFHSPADANWWLGTAALVDSNVKYNWNKVSNTGGFGTPSDPDFGTFGPEHIFWMGDFDENNIDDILFHYKGDGNWWLGTYGGIATGIRWKLAGNTHGQTVAGTPLTDFGQFTDQHMFWSGNFDGDRGIDILFHYKGDGNWWLGSFGGDNLTPPGGTIRHWSRVGNTSGVGPNQPDFGGFGADHIFWSGSFGGKMKDDTGKTRDDILFHYKGDGNWWLGSHDKSLLLIGNQ